MRFFAILYLLCGVFFFFRPAAVFHILNVGPKIFEALVEIPPQAESFWLVLATSMMAMLCVTSFYSSLYPRAKGYVMVHVVSKAVSISGFLFLFLHQQRYFAYIAGAVIDALIVLVVLAFFLPSLAAKAPLEASAAPARDGSDDLGGNGPALG